MNLSVPPPCPSQGLFTPTVMTVHMEMPPPDDLLPKAQVLTREIYTLCLTEVSVLTCSWKTAKER